MKTMKQFLLAGAIALTAATLTTACSDKNDDEGGGTSWDAGKIAGSVAGTWWGTHSSDATVTIEGTTLYGEKGERLRAAAICSSFCRMEETEYWE